MYYILKCKKKSLKGEKMIQNYLDKDNKIFILPKKKNKRMQVYEYLIDKFEQDRIYTEKEVNIIINDNHSFNDLCLTVCKFI